MNWINSWRKGNKKEKYCISIRLGTLTVFEIKYCICSESGICKKYVGKEIVYTSSCSKFRFMILNFGFEI